MFPKKYEPTWKLYYLDKEGNRDTSVKPEDFKYLDLKVMRIIKEKGGFWMINDQIIIIPSEPEDLPTVYTLDSDVP